MSFFTRKYLPDFMRKELPSFKMVRKNKGPLSEYRTKREGDKPFQNTYNYRNWKEYYNKDWPNHYPVYDESLHYIASIDANPVKWCDDYKYKDRMGLDDDQCDEHIREALAGYDSPWGKRGGKRRRMTRKRRQRK
jgi:hypothetical protein